MTRLEVEDEVRALVENKEISTRLLQYTGTIHIESVINPDKTIKELALTLLKESL